LKTIYLFDFELFKGCNLKENSLKTIPTYRYFYVLRDLFIHRKNFNLQKSVKKKFGMHFLQKAST